MKNRRENYIGGSDIASILGFGSLTPYEIYLLKKGEIKITPTSQMKMGKRLEPVIYQAYLSNPDLTVTKPTNGWLFNFDENQLGIEVAHPDYAFLRGHLDGYHPEKGIILECKASRHRIEECPVNYQLQVAYYCLLTGALRADIAVLNNTTDFTVFTYEKNLKLEQFILEKAVFFWENHVKKNQAPELISLDDLRENNKHIRKSLIEGKSLTASKNLKEKLIAYQAAKKNFEDAEKVLNTLKVGLLNEIKDHEIILDENSNILATYKFNKSSGFSVDKEKLIQEFPEIWEKVKIESSLGRQFRVKI